MDKIYAIEIVCTRGGTGRSFPVQRNIGLPKAASHGKIQASEHQLGIRLLTAPPGEFLTPLRTEWFTTNGQDLVSNWMNWRVFQPDPPVSAAKYRIYRHVSQTALSCRACPLFCIGIPALRWNFVVAIDRGRFTAAGRFRLRGALGAIHARGY